MAVVKGSVQLAAVFNQMVSSGVITPQNIPASIPLTTQYANGTGAGMVDLIYAKQLSLAATPTSLDLTSLTDLAGGAVNFARVREFFLQVVDATTGHDVIVGDAASNAWAPVWGATGTDTVFAGCYMLHADPNSVGSGHGMVVGSSSKVVKLDPGANTVVVNILIVGCSALS